MYGRFSYNNNQYKKRDRRCRKGVGKFVYPAGGFVYPVGRFLLLTRFILAKDGFFIFVKPHAISTGF